MRLNIVTPRGNVPLKGVRKVCSFHAEKCADFKRKKHRYALPQRSHATLSVYNMLGQVVATLVNGEVEGGLTRSGVRRHRIGEWRLRVSVEGGGICWQRSDSSSFVEWTMSTLLTIFALTSVVTTSL